MSAGIRSSLAGFQEMLAARRSELSVEWSNDALTDDAKVRFDLVVDELREHTKALDGARRTSDGSRSFCEDFDRLVNLQRFCDMVFLCPMDIPGLVKYTSSYSPSGPQSHAARLHAFKKRTKGAKFILSPSPPWLLTTHGITEIGSSPATKRPFHSTADAAKLKFGPYIRSSSLSKVYIPL